MGINSAVRRLFTEANCRLCISSYAQFERSGIVIRPGLQASILKVKPLEKLVMNTLYLGNYQRLAFSAILQNHLLHLLPPMATNYLLSGRGIYLTRAPAVQSDSANKPLVTRLSHHGSGIGCKRQRIPHCCDIQDSTYDIHMVCKHSACSCTQNSSAM